MKEFFDSELYAWTGLILNIVTFLGVIIAFLLIRHHNKLRHYPIDLDCGLWDSSDEEENKRLKEEFENLKKEQRKSKEYSETKWCKILNAISKAF